MEKIMNEPINIALPNTAKEKMAAIVALSQAIRNVSQALVSVQVDITVSNNTITAPETGIKIDIEDKLYSKGKER